MSNLKSKVPGKPRVIVLVVIGIVVIALAVGAYLLNTLRNYKKDVDAIQIQNVDITSIEDGEYFGDCDVGLVSAKVRVVVENQAITEIELLEHNNGRGSAAETLPGEIIREQRVDVDAISGATASSKVILESVYNALTGKRTIMN